MGIQFKLEKIYASLILYKKNDYTHHNNDANQEYQDEYLAENLGGVIDEMIVRVDYLESIIRAIDQREKEEKELLQNNPALKDIWDTYQTMRALVTGEVDADFDVGESSVQYERHS